MSDEHPNDEHAPVGEHAPAEECGREMIAGFLKPNPDCLLCGSEVSFAVNRDWLDGKSYEELAKEHQDDYRKASGGHPLTPTTLAVHFNGHVNAKGAAVNKWSKSLAARQSQTAIEAMPSEDGDTLFDSITQRGQSVNKQAAADLVIMEMVSNLKDMKRDIAERRAEGRTFDLAVAMKEFGKLLQGFHTNLIKAAETESKLEVNASNIQSARVLDFAVLRSLPDSRITDDEFARNAEQLWFTIAVKHIVGRLDEAMRDTQLDAPTRAAVLGRIKASMQGLDESVSDEYEREMRPLRSERGIIDVEPESEEGQA